jgi:hypothetical protein
MDKKSRVKNFSLQIVIVCSDSIALDKIEEKRGGRFRYIALWMVLVKLMTRSLEMLGEDSVFGLKHRFLSMKTLFSYLLLIVLSWNLVSCSDRVEPSSRLIVPPSSQLAIAGKLSEVPPPAVIGQLRSLLDRYQPQVTILSPQANQVLATTTANVQIQVKDLPIFKDADLGLGPHLHLILDNEPYQAVYDVEHPISLENLTPGTHTLRVFASRPWHESFKNDGAYAQTTFHVFTKTEGSAPDPALPLLTYSRPTGTYGAEPIMLDFFLTNAPLRLTDSDEQGVGDWRIRVTVNGQSFLLDSWQPIYLRGFEPGENWVQLEFLDGQGNPVKNAFNNTVRLITYQPKGQDTLSKLMRGELSAAVARAIADPNYKAELLPTPTPAVAPTPTEELPAPAQESLQSPETVPVQEEPLSEPSPAVAPTPTAELPASVEEIAQPPETLPVAEEESLPTPSPIVAPAPTTELQVPVEEVKEKFEGVADKSPLEQPVSTSLTQPPSEERKLQSLPWVDTLWGRFQQFKQSLPRPSAPVSPITPAVQAPANSEFSPPQPESTEPPTNDSQVQPSESLPLSEETGISRGESVGNS